MKSARSSGRIALSGAIVFILLLGAGRTGSVWPGFATAGLMGAGRAARLIEAAAGGTLTSLSGRATLVIPPRSLGADTEVSITELPPAKGPAVGPVFELLPDGLAFSSPATLTVRYKPADVPKGYHPEDVAVVQLLPEPEVPAKGGLGGSMDAAARPPYRNLETRVDPAAGTAAVSLSHLSRYSARAYATFDLSEWNGDLLGNFDFGQSASDQSGTAVASSAYDLFGLLEATVHVPLGSEGQGWAWACLWQAFRVVRKGLPEGVPKIGHRDIVIPFQHRGTIAPDTNTYDMQYNFWFAADDFSQREISAGMYIPEGREAEEQTLPGAVEDHLIPPEIVLALPGIYWQSYHLRPGARQRAIPSLPPYAPQRGSVAFRNVLLKKDHFYAMGVSLFVSLKGRPAQGKRPAEGGAVRFEGSNFVVLPVRIRQPAAPGR